MKKNHLTNTSVLNYPYILFYTKMIIAPIYLIEYKMLFIDVII